MSLPLPARLPCCRTVKKGVPLTRCRDSGAPSSFMIEVLEGFDVMQAKAKSAFVAKGLVWNDAIDLYLKPSKQAPQRLFVKLSPSSFMPSIQTAWHTARLRKSGHQDVTIELYVYVPKTKKEPTMYRATKDRVEKTIPRVRAALEAAGMDFGPATLRYSATAQARLPDTHVVSVPDNTTFRQLQRIDTMEREAAAAVEEPSKFVEIEVKLLMSVQSLRRAAGLPSYAFRPPYREPPAHVPPPAADDMEDVDHALTDDDEEEDDEILVE